MKCALCDYDKRLKAKYVKYDFSKESGIDGCELSDVKQYTCPRCKNVFHHFDMDDINKQIATILASAEALTRTHVKWIRTQFLGLDFWQFAKIVRTNPQYLKDLENHKRPMTKEIQDIVQNHLAKKLLTKKIKFIIE
jgi:hypothetical protein